MSYMMLLIALSQVAASPPNPNPAPLPPGAILVMSDDGHPRSCKPGPTAKADRAFKDGCRAFIESAGQMRAAVPVGDSAAWVELSDAPPSALALREHGASVVTLEIGIDGKPQTCSVVRSSGFEDLDEAACSALMRRARFKPALDYDGTPNATTYTRAVVWRVP